MTAHPPTIDETVDALLLGGRAPQILLAEDDAEMRALLAVPLREEGYVVLEADNGVDLLRALHRLEVASCPVRLVITDLRMPGYDGLEVLAYLRCAGVGVPVIVITAFGDDEVHEIAERLDAARIFDKPFDIDDLCSAVAHLVPLPKAS